MIIFKLIKLCWMWRWVLRSLPQTLYFNFHYLPLAQAVKLPILLYKPTLRSLKGRVEIKGAVGFGMIQMGRCVVPLYPNSGIMFENNGGTLTFSGQCIIGNNSALSVADGARLCVGNGVVASTTLRLACYKSIVLHDRVRLGWDVTVLDTDFHKLTLEGGGYSNPTRQIEIGENCWLGLGCTVLKGTVLPPYTTVSAKTVLNKRYEIPEKCIIGTDTTVVVKKTGVYRNLEDDLI